jgi:hypothetical protein
MYTIEKFVILQNSPLFTKVLPYYEIHFENEEQFAIPTFIHAIHDFKQTTQLQAGKR